MDDNELAQDTAQNTAQPSQQDPSQQQTGGRLRTLKSGAVYDLDKGRIVSMDVSKNEHAITSANAHDYHALRLQSKMIGMQAWQSGMLKAAKTDTLHSAVAAVAEAQTSLAMDVKNHPNASVRAAELSLRAAGVLTDDRLDRLDVNINHNLPDFSAVRRLLAAVSGELEGEGQAVDVEWTDLE